MSDAGAVDTTGSHPMAGYGAVTVARVGIRSVVKTAVARSPLRLLTPGNHGAAAWVFTSTYGGGMVDRDHVAMHVDVQSAGMAYVSTQASTKVYRSPRGTRAETVSTVGRGGLLVLAPDPVVCFAGARYRQHQRIDLDEDAGLVLIDCLTSGRVASGERWQADEYDSRIVVHDRGALVLHEALALRASDGSIADRLGRFDVLALVVVAGEAMRGRADALLAVIEARGAEARADQLIAAARLSSGGCVVRVAGRSAERVGSFIREHLHFVPELLGDDPWRRKW